MNNMIVDIAGSSTARRGFADLFEASKTALDNIQAGLGGALPSVPGMPVAKFGDLSIGIDMHPTVTPPSPIMPVPHVGKVYDLRYHGTNIRCTASRFRGGGRSGMQRAQEYVPVGKGA